MLKALFDFAVEFIFPRSSGERILANASIEKWRALLPAAEIFEDGLAVFSYDHPLCRELIWSIKYRGDRVLAAKGGILMWEEFLSAVSDEHTPAAGNIILIPAPQSLKRKMEKGFNQAEILAEEMARASQGSARLGKGLLVKRKDTPHQTDLPKQKRLTNLEKAFAVTKAQEIKGATAIFVDDVATTGATIREARRALRAAGLRKFYAITLAH